MTGPSHWWRHSFYVFGFFVPQLVFYNYFRKHSRPKLCEDFLKRP